jgi:hypothetical protein
MPETQPRSGNKSLTLASLSSPYDNALIPMDDGLR